MTETQMKAEIAALRDLLRQVAIECDVREFNAIQVSAPKPIKLATYDKITSAIWGDGGCPRLISQS